jgi:transposase InsO family protein
MTSRKKSRYHRSSRQNRYSVELKLRAVQLYLEEGYSAEMVAEELGIGKSTLGAWAKRYREEGAAGLEYRVPTPSIRKQVDPRVKAKAVELKRQDPQRGSRRISHLLKRLFFMQASPETVRRTLKDNGLVERPKKKPQRNPSRPRFFERSTPNQLWQTDIFTFRLGGRNAYLIGYLDDYSRYITGLGLYRSQTAEHVIETFRRAVAEYGVPKEMLTDNGRQYTNWRGTTRFEAELKKDRIAHIKSRPHHPMTLGKIERFWKSIFGEFLSRVQFDSFEQAQQRLALWVKYYNYKRPHQGIGGLCPADRFFEIQSALRQVLEKGVEDNVLESALRGQPQKPFYMVGRMGDQSVVIRAEKGKVKMLVDGEESESEQELVYHVNEHKNEEQQPGEGTAGVCGESEVRSDPGGVVRAQKSVGNLPGAEGPVAATEQLAEGGHEGDDGGPAATAEPGAEPGAVTEPSTGEAPLPCRTESQAPEQAGATTGVDTAERSNREDHQELIERIAAQAALLDPGEAPIVLELLRECTPSNTRSSDHGQTDPASPGKEEGRTDPQSASRTDDRDRGSPGAGDQSQDLLQMGTAGTGGDAGRPLRAELGPAAQRIGWTERSTAEEDPGAGKTTGTET